MQEKIDLSNYPRKGAYEAFLHHEVPVLSTTCEVDITVLYEFRQKHKLRFFPLLTLMIDRTVNEIESMRHRIINGKLYEFDRVHPSFTTLLTNNTISFCDAFHMDNTMAFYEHIIALSDATLEISDVEMREKYDRYFISNIPWIRFSSFTHPYSALYASIPIVTTGKFQNKDNTITMPIALQVHHSLADGYHIGQFYSLLEQNIKNAPEILKNIIL